ncbi:MAG: response regulator [Bacteroidetes bacterium]|nr:response regulator [Bacteroidota bacterium]
MTGPTSLRILLVEDNLGDTMLVRHTIERTMPEAKLETVSTVSACLQRLLSGPSVDLILTDHNLPDGDGLEVIAHVRELGHVTPVVVLTGVGREDVAVAAMKAGAYDYLTKAPDLSHLEKLPLVLQDVLRRRELERQLTELEQQRAELEKLRLLQQTIAAINHEINNPLSIITGYVQMLLSLASSYRLDPEVVHALEAINEAAERIAEITRRLAALKKIVLTDYVDTSILDIRRSAEEN